MEVFPVIFCFISYFQWKKSFLSFKNYIAPVLIDVIVSMYVNFKQDANEIPVCDVQK